MITNKKVEQTLFLSLFADLIHFNTNFMYIGYKQNILIFL
jgi:hypothetical protein